jgi:hypothetical protein
MNGDVRERLLRALHSAVERPLFYPHERKEEKEEKEEREKRFVCGEVFAGSSGTTSIVHCRFTTASGESAD